MTVCTNATTTWLRARHASHLHRHSRTGGKTFSIEATIAFAAVHNSTQKVRPRETLSDTMQCKRTSYSRSDRRRSRRTCVRRSVCPVVRPTTQPPPSHQPATDQAWQVTQATTKSVSPMKQTRQRDKRDRATIFKGF